MTSRSITVDVLARVEGEGALTLVLDGDSVVDARLRLFEPPRLFEALLRGRAAVEAPDITARICGICPVAYQMSACHAVEDAAGVTIGGTLRALRRLLYCGEWIESHVLHMVMLHAPDFLDLPDAIAIGKAHPERVRAALAIKKVGNAIVAALGGRAIHPINVKVGGFYRAPTTSELAQLLPELRWARDAADDLLDWLATFEFPALERDYELVALRHPDEYPMNEGRLVSTRGLDIAPRDFLAHIEEHQVPYSTALHARIIDRGAGRGTGRGSGRGPGDGPGHGTGEGAYLTGPLARFALNADRLAPRAAAAASRIGLDPSCRNPYRTLLVRGVETVHALDEAIRIIEAYTPPAPSAVAVPLGAGVGHAITEAPRGILYHRYQIDDTGAIADARIIPPTSQNQRSIEDDLRAMGPMLASLSLDAATRRAEHAIRNHDPCISCSTHFLTLTREQAKPPAGEPR